MGALSSHMGAIVFQPVFKNGKGGRQHRTTRFSERSRLYVRRASRNYEYTCSTFINININSALYRSLALLALQSRFGGKLLETRVGCPQNRTAVLKGVKLDVAFWGQNTRVSSLNPLRAAVRLWGQPTHVSSCLSPKRDCSPKRG